MQFSVPQFIEHETKIVGPLTFKQFVYIGVAGGICFFLYFTIAKINFFLFLVLALPILVGGAALAFVRIGGHDLPTTFANFFNFAIGSKVYIWKKKGIPITVFKKVEVKKEIKDEKFSLKIAEKSQLKKIRNEIELKTR